MTLNRHQPFKELIMKTIAIPVLIAISTIMVLPAFAARDPALTARMEACFRAHAKLMDKPAVRNVEACWRAHGYLMGKR